MRAPSILVDGRFHTTACEWLLRKYHLRPVDHTLASQASRLAGYVSFLRNERGLNHPDEWQADVFAASEDDVQAFYRARQFTPETKVSSVTWRAQLSTVKQFHEYLRAKYGLSVPFRIETFILPRGFSVTSAVDLRPRTRTGSRGIPVTPGYAELLIQGAYQIDRNGRQTYSKNVDRDAGFISLAFGTGMRLGSLTDITTFEIPPRTNAPFSVIRVPDFITKGDAGGDALVFAHRLNAVHNYIEGARAELIDRSRKVYRPEDPIYLEEADSETWTAKIDGNRRSYRWTETASHTRRRLVDPDGATPLLWLNSYVPTPIGWDHAGTVTTGARDWTRSHILAEFPAGFRTHDCRHTYATHLAVCIFKQAVSAHMHPDVTEAYTPARVADAVEIAKLSLGHSSEDSTRLYTFHAHKFLHLDVEEFLGIS